MNAINPDIHIGVSATILNRNDTLDGIGVYTQSLLREYQKLGLTPKAYTFPPLKKPGFELLPKGFKRIAVRSLMPISPVTPMPLDVFHVTDYRSFPMSCPVVTTLFDAIPFVDPEMTNTHLRGLKNWMLKRSAHYADRVIAISNYSVAELVEHYEIPPEKISVVYCGVDEDWLNTPPETLVNQVLTRRGLERGYFLNVGTIQPRKNLGRVLAAHDRLPKTMRQDFPLVVVGHAGWKCQEIIKALHAKIEKGEAHWFNDVCSRDELKCLFAAAGSFVFPSLYEGFGLPVLEAFAVGTPVITSNTTSLPEVSMGIGLEIDPTNMDELVDAMRQVHSLPDLDSRIAAGKQRAAQLSWRHCAEETLKVYQRVIRGVR